MTQKGVYPYHYMDSFERSNEIQLPSKDDFFSQLTQDAITEEQYCHAIKVWGTFNLQTMGDHHDLYLKSDILLLADVFENFRSTCLQYYKLDPCHYVTSPGLSWDAMLKMTDIKLELMTDIDMFQFVEKGTRGGISYIANRYGGAYNKYMKEYNKEKPSKYIMYLDSNNCCCCCKHSTLTDITHMDDSLFFYIPANTVFEKVVQWGSGSFEFYLLVRVISS